MPNRGDRGGAQTRARISAVATELFLERGFDDVTVAEVASAAGVSKVTVFAHFERKEDLMLDRLPDAVELVRRTVRDRADQVGVLEALHLQALALADERHPLSLLSPGVEPYLKVVLEAPSLVARLRTFAQEVEAALTEELAADARFVGDPELVAALVVATYRVVGLATVRARLEGTDPGQVTALHRERLRDAFAALEHGL